MASEGSKKLMSGAPVVVVMVVMVVVVSTHNINKD